ncbi:MAG: hypothetical protein AAB726_02595 [Patescibacteria group bacterium]
MRNLIAMVAAVFVLVQTIFLCGCGYGHLDVLGRRVVSFSQSDVLVVNNINGVVLRELTISNGHFYLEDRGDGVLTAPEVSTGETVAGEIGYVGRYGYGRIQLSAKVHRVSDGKFLGLAFYEPSVGGGRYDAGREQVFWVVDTFEPVGDLQEVPVDVYYGR